MNSLVSFLNVRVVLVSLLSLNTSFKIRAMAQGGAVPVVGLSQEDNSWSTKKYTHKFKSLTLSELNKVASRNNEALLRSFVETIMIPRIVGTDGHQRVNAFISKTMRDLGWIVERDTFESKTPFGVKSFTNIIATLPIGGGASSSSGSFSSSASLLPPRRLAIACHYDSKYYKEFEFLAATDSAVPCAMMLHLASSMNEYLHRHRTRNNDVTLELIFFDGEEAFVDWTAEDSIYGSRHLAQLWQNTPFPKSPSSSSSPVATNRLDSLDFLMLLDLIGEAGPSFHNFFPATSRHYERLMRIEKKMSKAGLLVEGDEEWSPCRERNGCNKYFPSSFIVSSFIEDDHVPFLQRGVPILHMIPYPFPKGWHNRGDNGENLHYPTIYNLAKIFSAFVAEYLSLPLK